MIHVVFNACMQGLIIDVLWFRLYSIFACKVWLPLPAIMNSNMNLVPRIKTQQRWFLLTWIPSFTDTPHSDPKIKNAFNLAWFTPMSAWNHYLPYKCCFLPFTFERIGHRLLLVIMVCWFHHLSLLSNLYVV